MRKQSGQVMIVGIIMMLILLLAIFIFFDVHNVIRAKIKLETAEQSAALTAARWQAESLNLIGEINILIACERMLLDDRLNVPDDAHSSRDQAIARIRSLNEMQSRISFLGPLIAFGAAQQAAKNNGIANKRDYNSPLYDFGEYLRKLRSGDPRYLPFENVNGYYWREPYSDLLSEIVSNGVVVRPSDRVAGLENVSPSFLTDETFFRAILSCDRGINAWCHITLREIIKDPNVDDFFKNKWFSPGFNWISFPRQSEIYTLGVRRKATFTEYEQYLEFVQQGQKYHSHLVALPEYSRFIDDVDYHVCRWYAYESIWFPDSGNYSGPVVDGNSPWRGGYFLRDDLQPGMVYGGPVAYAESYQDVSSVLDFRGNPSPSKPFEKPVGSTNLINTRVGGNYSEDFAASGAVAKPIGSFVESGKAPTEIPLVLPIFRQAALIPSTMQRFHIFSVNTPPVERFIRWLANVEDLHDPNLTPPPGTEYMLQALLILEKPEFRRRGYNPDFTGALESLPQLSLFDTAYRYPANPRGPGWLQAACIRNDANPPPGALENDLYIFDRAEVDRLNAALADGETPYDYPPHDETWVYHGKKYFVIQKNGKIINNEDDPYRGCGILRTGPGPGIPPGTNVGPPRL